jgi:hypothetical protein
MEPILLLLAESLIKVALDKTVEISIEKVSVPLLNAIRRKNQTEVAEIIKNDKLQEKTAEIAGDAIKRSYIFPAVDDNVATADDLLFLFKQLLLFGFGISKGIRSDIFFPGSFVGTGTIIGFSSYGDVTYNPTNSTFKIQIEDRKMLIRSSSFNRITIEIATNALAVCEKRRSFLIDKRRRTSAYIQYDDNNDKIDNNFEIAEVDVQEVRYAATPEDVKAYSRGRSPSLHRSLPIKDWKQGISSVLDFSNQLTNIDFLPREDGENIRELAVRLSKVYGPADATSQSSIA